MKKQSVVLILATLFSGCSTQLSPFDSPITVFDIEAQTFTYSGLNGKEAALWEKARRHITLAYGKNQPILRVENKASGTLLGKGVVRWKSPSSLDSVECYSEYDIRFMARDHKARLQLTLLPGVPTLSGCENWGLPSQFGYEQILNKFELMSDSLHSVLRDVK
ncbi:hypothetical protein [Aliivibrio sifiae]|uniref:DUF4468 domain-containing protein n=1 Tax=Aliivibrio sifiae TaxID=566293 RepID=A0A2S7XDN4_9GAMM|nr:hypothetical protein [Aliivibrio sifiae]PQJ89225.1 hypothetical protein BTO22_06330 [Aliivibrio sifiae]